MLMRVSHCASAAKSSNATGGRLPQALLLCAISLAACDPVETSPEQSILDYPSNLGCEKNSELVADWQSSIFSSIVAESPRISVSLGSERLSIPTDLVRRKSAYVLCGNDHDRPAVISSNGKELTSRNGEYCQISSVSIRINTNNLSIDPGDRNHHFFIIINPTSAGASRERRIDNAEEIIPNSPDEDGFVKVNQAYILVAPRNSEGKLKGLRVNLMAVPGFSHQRSGIRAGNLSATYDSDACQFKKPLWEALAIEVENLLSRLLRDGGG